MRLPLELSLSSTGLLSSFSPADLGSTLKMWIDPSDTTNRTTSSGKITALADKSGNGNGATLFTGSGVPIGTGIGGRDTLAFDGTSYLSLPNFSSFTAAEIFAVVKASGDAPSSGNGLWLLSAVHTTLYPFSDGIIYDGFGSSVRQTQGDPGNMAIAHIYNAISTSSEWTSNIDGIQLFTTGTNTVSFHTFGWLGANGSGAQFTGGEVGEIIMCDTKVSTTTDRTNIHTYLQTKWTTP